MKQTSPPHPVAASETEQPNLPVESIALASETTVDTAPTLTPAPYEIPERSDDRYYTRHWGINE